MVFKSLAFVVALVSLVGCATSSYTVKVDAIADADISAESFVIKSGLKEANDNDLRFKEYSKIVSNSLQRKGFKPVADVKVADMVVMLSYGISDPNTKTYTRSVPVYGGQNGTTTTVTNNYGQNIGSFQTQPSNPYAPTGYQSVTDEVTTYNRFVLITAYDAKDVLKPRPKEEKFDPKMMWETKVTSTGSSSDLRKVFPVMMLGAIPFIGKNSGEQQVIDIDIDHELDSKVKELLSGNQTPSKRVPAASKGH